MKPRRRRFWLLLAGLALFAIAWPATRLWRTELALRRYRAGLEARGEHLTAASLAVPLDLAARRAGAELAFALARGRNLGNRSDLPAPMRYVAAGFALPAVRSDEQQARALRTNAWPDLVREMAQHRDRLEAARAILAVSSKLDFNVNYAQGFDLTLPHLSGLRDVVRVAAHSVVLHLRAGETSEAVADLRVALALIQSYSDEAIMVSQLTRAAMASSAVSATWDVLQSEGAKEGELAGLQEDWERLRLLGPVVRALEMDRLVQIGIFREARANPAHRRRLFQSLVGGGGGLGPGPGGGFAGVAGAATLSGFAERAAATMERSGELMRVWLLESLWRWLWCYEDELHALQVNQVMLGGVRAGERGEPFAAVLKRANVELQAHGDSSWSDQLRWLFSRQLSAYGRVIQRPLAAEAQRQLTLVAIALRRYYLRNRSFPDRIEALVPGFLAAVPKDPFDGQTLRYRVDEQGRFLLYSVGEDGIDQGGDATPMEGSPYQASFWRGHDLVWPRAATAEEVKRAEVRGGSGRSQDGQAGRP